jgi:hypothetical protein
MRSTEFCRQYDRDFVIEVKCLEDIKTALESAGIPDEERTSKYD